MASFLPKMHVLLSWCRVVFGRQLPNAGPLYWDMAVWLVLTHRTYAKVSHFQADVVKLQIGLPTTLHFLAEIAGLQGLEVDGRAIGWNKPESLNHCMESHPKTFNLFFVWARNIPIVLNHRDFPITATAACVILINKEIHPIILWQISSNSTLSSQVQRN